MTLGSTAQQESVLIYTNISSTLASNERPGDSGEILAALCFGCGLGLLTLRRRSALRGLGLLVCGFALLGTFSGCNAGGTSSTLLTPPGTYTVSVIFTGSGGLTTIHTATVSLTVIQDSGSF
jgi:hypothetical protein